MDWNYRNADCSLKTKLSVSLVLIFGTLSFPVRFNAHTSGNRQTKARISHYTRRVVMFENSGVCKKINSASTFIPRITSWRCPLCARAPPAFDGKPFARCCAADRRNRQTDGHHIVTTSRVHNIGCHVCLYGPKGRRHRPLRCASRLCIVTGVG